jgi:hypothetical protein
MGACQSKKDSKDDATKKPPSNENPSLPAFTDKQGNGGEISAIQPSHPRMSSTSPLRTEESKENNSIRDLANGFP